MIYVVATSQVKPELRDAFIKGARECIAATRKEKGCLSYESHTSINDPNLFVVVERWETREDLNAHGRAPHMKVWREYSAPLKVSADRDRDHQRRQGREALCAFRPVASWFETRGVAALLTMRV